MLQGGRAEGPGGGARLCLNSAVIPSVPGLGFQLPVGVCDHGQILAIGTVEKLCIWRVGISSEVEAGLPRIRTEE